MRSTISPPSLHRIAAATAIEVVYLSSGDDDGGDFDADGSIVVTWLGSTTWGIVSEDYRGESDTPSTHLA